MVSGRPNRITPPIPSDSHFLALLDDLVDRHLVVARHGADLAADALARADEQRQDELRRVEARLAHQAAHGFGGAQAAQTMGREMALTRIVTPRCVQTVPRGLDNVVYAVRINLI